MNGNPGSGSREHWFWRLDFGDGTSQYYEQNERTVEHTFKRAGTYNVVLELHAFGGVASDSIVITTKERGPQGGVTVEPSQEPGVPPPTVPGGGEEEGDTGGGRGPQGGVTVEPTEEPEGEGEEPSPDEEPAIPPGGQPP
jgi:PKD repeat protein